MPKTTTVIGCGLMGSAIVRALHEKGHPLRAFNRSAGPLEHLSALGIATSTDINAAIQEADILLFVVSNYNVIRTLIETIDKDRLHGKVVVNLSSGSVKEAREIEALICGFGAHYLDGSIWATPAMIGAKDTVMTFSGSFVGWQDSEGVIKSAAGSAFFVGDAVEHANVLEACFLGSFFMSAQNCFAEAIRVASAAGIGNDVIARTLVPSLALLREGVDEILMRVEKQDFDATEATLDVYLAAARAYKASTTALSIATPHLDTTIAELEIAAELGKGPYAVAALLHE